MKKLRFWWSPVVILSGLLVACGDVTPTIAPSNSTAALTTLTSAAAPPTTVTASPTTAATTSATAKSEPTKTPSAAQLDFGSTLLSGHSGPVRSLAWSPDGKQLASGSEDNTLKMWGGNSKLFATVAGFSNGVYWLEWSPDSKLVATQDGRLWNFQGQLQTSLAGSFGGWSPDGKTLVFLKGKEVELKGLDGKLQSTLSIPAGFLGPLAWTADSKMIATGGQNVDQAGPSNIRLWLWKTDGTQLATISDYTRPIMSLDWSPDGKILAASGKGENQAFLWSADGKQITALPGNYVIWSLEWSPNGQYLAAGCDDGKVRLFSPDGHLITTLSGHTGAVWAVAWSSDGVTLASGSSDKTVRLWKITE
jgi:WD40 repeat protein